MWRRGRLIGGLAVAMVLGGRLGAAAPAEAVPLIVRWQDPQRALPFAAESLGGELQAMFVAAGVELTWVVAEPGIGREPGLNVVLLDSDRAGADSDVMGAVLPRSAGRTAWIMLRTVERTLDLRSSRRVCEAERRQALARALPRIIAHELVHLLAPEVPHLPGGLMDRRLGRSFLLGPPVALPAQVGAAVRAGAEAQRPRPSPLVAALG